MLEALLSPLRVGPVELPNRIVSTAHQTTLVHDHLPTEDFLAYHEARARGGTGLIVLEATAVDPSGLLTPHTLAGYREDSAAGFARVAEAVRPHGTRLFVQLFHGGREQIASPPRSPAISASAIPSRRFHVEPRAATAADIQAILDGYARSAANVAAAGLDGIEVSAAHEYLAAQFFTPELNRRDDEWAEPARFVLAVLDAVRGAAPGLALGVRLSADSSAARAVAGGLAGRVDYVSVALGASSTYLGSAGIVPPPPVPENAIAKHAAPFRLGPPLITTTRIVDPAEADRLIAGEVADAEAVTALGPDLAVVATGARPYVPEVALDGVQTVQAWDVLAGAEPSAARVVVADWGGDASGLASAELLAVAGAEVTLAVGSAAFGESIHQYQRNLYAQRLYRAGVQIEHHLELAGGGPGGVLFRNLFAPELETVLPADLLVLACGRVPERGLAEELAALGLPVAEAGDCLSPRSAEEAILEGTLAVAALAVTQSP